MTAAARLGLLAALLLPAACAPVPVWQRGAVTRPAMAPPGATKGAAFAAHARDVRGAALRPAAGGGATCGCN